MSGIYAPEVGEWVEGWDDLVAVTRQGKFAYHLNDRYSIIEEPVRGDSRVFQVDVVRSSLRKCVG